MLLRHVFWFLVLWGLAPAVFAAPRNLLELDPFAYIVVELGLIIAAVVVSHFISRRLYLPSILGELLVGLVVGNLLYWSGLSPLFLLIMHLGDASLLFREAWVTGASVIDVAGNIFAPEELEPGNIGARLINIMVGHESPGLVLMGSALWHFSNLGILFLWFRMALGMRLDDLLAVGRKAFYVAAGSMVVTLGLGLLVIRWLMPEAEWSTQFLLACGLIPTSASIALPLAATYERRFTSVARMAVDIILVADIAAVVLISTAISFVQTGSQTLWSAFPNLIGIAGYLAAVFYLCRKAPTWKLPWLSEMEEYKAKLLLPLGLAFLMAWIADLLTLSSLIGIFGAGMIINRLDLKKRCRGRLSAIDLMHPLTQLFAPAFFVLLGMQINLGSFLSFHVLGMSILLIGVAVGARLLCGWLVVQATEGWLLGWTMVPRGEMALVVAATGKSLGIMDDVAYAAFMVMVIASMILASIMVRRKAPKTPTSG